MSQFRVLVVDDEPLAREIAVNLLRADREIDAVVECGDGESARDHIARDRPDIVFLDIEMPGLDGQSVLREIKSDPDLRDIPVVMMTGVAEEKQMEEAARNGANSYTLKPANAEQFLRTVLASTTYWLTIHQYPTHHLPAVACRR